MKSRYEIRVFNSRMFLIVYLFAGLYSCAQPQESLSKTLTTTEDGFFHKTSFDNGVPIHVGVVFGMRNR